MENFYVGQRVIRATDGCIGTVTAVGKRLFLYVKDSVPNTEYASSLDGRGWDNYNAPFIDLDQDYWVSRDDGRVRARVAPDNRYSKVWPKTCHRVRFTGYEVIE